MIDRPWTRDVVFALVIGLVASLSLPAVAAPSPHAPRCMGHRATIEGTSGDDTIEGTKHRDVIVALGGNDVIDAKAGSDLICSGPGDDVVAGGDGRDRFDAGVGDDRFAGGEGDDRASGGSGDDHFGGGPGDDHWSGGPGRDSSHGGDGRDGLDGNGGDDFLDGGDGFDRLDGGPDVDRCINGETVLHCERPGPRPSPSPSTTPTGSPSSPAPSASPTPTSQPSASPSSSPSPTHSSTPPTGGGGQSSSPPPSTSPSPTATAPSGADLSMQKSDQPDPVSQNSTLTYTLVTSNSGPDEAVAVVATDTLPQNVTVIQTSPNCAEIGGNQVRCDIGTLSPGSGATNTIVVRPNDYGVITDTATVGSGTPDPNPANNTDSESTTVRAAGSHFSCAQLQAALDASQPGDVIIVDGICVGQSFRLPPWQITLEGDPTDGLDGFDGTGAPLNVLSGQDVMTTTIQRLIFRDSTSTASAGGGSGGAIALTGTVAPRIVENSFTNNHADLDGGAVFIDSFQQPTTTTVDGNSFGGNDAGPGGFGGALAVSEPGALAAERNDFANNVADGSGGGFYLQVGSTYLTANDVGSNSAGGDGGGGFIQAGRTTLVSNDFHDNDAVNEGGGVWIGSPVFLMFAQSTSASTADVVQSSNLFDGNTLSDTTEAAEGVGELISGLDAFSTNDRFTNNSSPTPGAEGGGLALFAGFSNQSFVGRNLVAAGNSLDGTSLGAGIYTGAAQSVTTTVSLFDSTVAGNVAGPGSSGAGIASDGGDSLDITNTILVSNTVSGSAAVSGAGVDYAGFVVMSATYSDVCATPGVPFAGAGNICADPRLVDPFPGAADVHETASSPTVDSGSNALVPADLTTDYEGDPRIVGGTVDIGADEST